MTTSMQDTAHEQSAMSSRAEAVGRELARYGLVVVVGWIGLMKFTAYEAEGIHPFLANSPLMSWVYGFMSVRGFSAMLGVVEVAIAILIAARPYAPRASAVGSALAVGMFLTPLSFLVTTPGVWARSAGGFPALSALPGSSSSSGSSPTTDSPALIINNTIAPSDFSTRGGRS
jgi:reactive chlorine resistance protein C